jgi:TrmH family RNA methyltransferase
VITSPHNDQLKLIRRLRRKRERVRTGLLLAEGEDLVAAAEAAGFEPQALLVAGVDVEPGLLARFSGLGSGSRVVGVYRQRWSPPGGALAAYLHGVGDPGNVGTIIRSAHALCDGPVVLGEGCADPWSPKAVRASMGSVFARPPARARLEELRATAVALDRDGDVELAELGAALAATGAPGPRVLCLGAERAGLPPDVLERAAVRVRIPLRPDGPESLNVAMAATLGLYEAGRAGGAATAAGAANRMARGA